MSDFINKNIHLFGKNVSVLCLDRTTITGIWTEYFDEETNDWMEEEGMPVCESILVGNGDKALEINVPDIVSIKSA